GFVHAELRLAVQLVAERLALDEGHDVEQEAVGRARVEERENVRVLQGRGGLDLHYKALGAKHRRQLRLQHLERDVAIVLQVVREVHRRHPAGAEFALDGVAAGKRGIEAFRYRRHRFAACARSSAAQLGMTTICSAELITGRSMRNDLPSGETSKPAWPMPGR